jgi:hypothetical protein
MRYSCSTRTRSPRAIKAVDDSQHGREAVWDEVEKIAAMVHHTGSRGRLLSERISRQPIRVGRDDEPTA